MRDQFPFFGIKSPQRKALMKQFLAEHGPMPIAEAEEILLSLWAQPERECQYVAMDQLDKVRKKLPSSTIALVETLLTTKSWWDTVDLLASHDVGYFFKHYPETQSVYLPQWRQSDNLWLRRTAILFQLHYKKQTDEALLFEIVRENLGATEFFINKAIGWALRNYSKVNETAVVTFVKNTDLAPLSEKEALKWLKAQGKV